MEENRVEKRLARLLQADGETIMVDRMLILETLAMVKDLQYRLNRMVTKYGSNDQPVVMEWHTQPVNRTGK